ncbi:MAG: chloride channel protein [Moraxella sp.]|nr:chloride channel protein [Moraxella sp.]
MKAILSTHGKPALIALGYGALAGAISAITLFLMTSLQHHLWAQDWANTPLGIATVIMVGGILLAVLHHYYHANPTHQGLSDELSFIPNPKTLIFLALSAIIAVAFGGAIGPEAGLLAVVAECSLLVGGLLKNSYHAQLIHQTGVMASLSGLYGSPPAALALDDDAIKLPMAIKLLAGLSGLIGFWGMHQLLTDKAFAQLPIPAHTAHLSDVFYAIPAIILGAAAGVLFLYLHHHLPNWLSKISGHTSVQILFGTGIFALIASAVPLVRFSGHHEIEHALAHGVHGDVGFFVVLIIAKLVAMAVCLASGWRGGEFFPAVFVGFAVAYMITLVLPSVPLTVAIMGAVGSTVVVCMGKPVAAILILLLLAGVHAPTALIAGVLFGAFVRQLMTTSS